MNILDYKFTFETEQDYERARSTGYIPDYDMVRVHTIYSDGYDVDYPVHSREELISELIRLNKAGASLQKIYPSKHYYDVLDYANYLSYI